MSRRARHPAIVEEGLVAGLTQEGEGVIRGGKTVFVAGALPGETVRFLRRRQHRQHDEGQLEAVLSASAERVEPRCRHFGVCGGCALQHLGAESQRRLKHEQLAEALQRLGRVEPARWLDPLTGPAWQYRRRARLGVRYVPKKGRVVVGFRERHSNLVAETQRCEVLAAPVGELIAPLAELIGALSIRERLPQVEVAVGARSTALVLRVLLPPTAADRSALAAFAARHGVELWLQPAGIDSAAPLDLSEPLFYELSAGAPPAVRLDFRPTDFVQINEQINASLVARAIELLELEPASRVLDLYCGLGNFSLPLARHAAGVLGLEGDPGLIARARANAARNEIGHARFECADLAAEQGDQRWWREPFTHVLLDPPRLGARALLGQIARLAPRRVLYVSCHPATLARDVGELVHEFGFSLLAAGIADMFPQTSHVEALALLAPAG